MSKSKQKQPPKSQIRAQILSQFSKQGFQQDLKKQLRIQICQKLKEKDLIKKQQTHQDKLYNRIIASLISQFLLANDCGYSNSIYVLQCGVDGNVLSREEIVELMGMAIGDFDDKVSVIQNIVRKKYPFNGGTFRSVSIQTNPQEVGYTLQQRLALIDQQYRQNAIKNSPNKQQNDYKKKIEQLEYDLKRNYQRDIQRFKQFEAHNIKVKTSQQWRKKFEQYTHSISEQYRRKMQNLRKKERALQDNIISKTKTLDQKVTTSHKAFLQKIDILDIKSSTMAQTKKNLQIQQKHTKQQYQKAQKELKQKIRQYDNLLLNVNSKIQYEVGIVKLALQQQYQDKNAQFLARKKFIDEEYGKIMGIKDTTDIVKEESKRLFEENMRLRAELIQVEKQFRVSVSQGAAQGERLDSLRGEVFKVEKQAKQKQEALKDLSKKYKRKQEQIIQMRRELDELREWKWNRQNSQSIINTSQLDQRKQSVVADNEPKSELQLKMQQLKKQRKKEIQKLKLQLLS